jgi:hypothetical protein
MSNEATAVPTPGETKNQAAAPAPQVPPTVAKAASETRRTAILAAYDILRPTGEIDARAQRVLVSALALIALCVVPEKPATFSFGGLSFSMHHWLALAIPLCIVVLYTMAELAVAWRIQWKRVSLILGGSVLSVQTQAHEELEPIITGGHAFLDEQDAIEAKRKEIQDWYQRRLKEVDAENLALEQAERFPAESFPQRVRNYDAVRGELKQREQQAGITAFDEKRDELIRTGFDQHDKLLRQNTQAIDEIRRLLGLKKIRHGSRHPRAGGSFLIADLCMGDRGVLSAQ